MAITLDDMIEQLQEYRNHFGGETEVRLQTQESWPMEYSIHQIISAHEIAELRGDGDEEEDDSEPEEAVVYLVEGSQLGYGTKRAWWER